MRPIQPRVATLVLCTRHGELLGALPPFKAALPWWQDAETLVRHVREMYAVGVTILRLLHASLPAAPGGEVSYLAEVSAGDARRLPLRDWPQPLDDQLLRLPYARPGGPGRDLSWARESLDSLGMCVTGEPEQVRTWNLSSLWRIPTNGGLVWLKHVPPFFAHEGDVIEALGDAPVPRLLAHDGARILMSEIPGADLYDAGVDVCRHLVDILVDLQVRWFGREARMAALGLPDWRGPALAHAIEDAVRRTAPALPDEDRAALTALVDGMPRRLAAVEECGIPDSLVHGDFAPGNARGAGHHVVLLDWGDCGIGHPLFDQSAFLDRIASDSVPAVKRHWAERWRRRVPGCDPERAAELLAPVAAARQAVVYLGFLDRIEPSEHPYHRADPATWLSRAAALG